MRFIRSRFAVATASLAYLLASALSGLMHNHAHGTAHVAAPLHQADAHDLSFEWHLGEQSEHDDDSSPSPVSDDDCLACRFVTQSALVSMPAPEPALDPIVIEVRSAAPTFFVEPIHSSGLARAPPIG